MTRRPYTPRERKPAPTIFISRHREGSRAPRNPILDAMRRWKVAPADMLWAIEKGAWKPNDRRTRALIGAAQVGTARLKPWEGHWTIHHAKSPNGIELEAVITHALRVLRRLTVSLSDAQIAALWDYDISEVWVREKLASRIREAGYIVVPTEGTKHRLSIEAVASFWEHDLSYHDVREGLARRIAAADLAVVPRPVNVGGTDHDG